MIDLLERQLASLQGMQEVSISATARAEGFHRQRVTTGGSQMPQEHRCENSFANTGVGAGDENHSPGGGRAGEERWIDGLPDCYCVVCAV